MIKRNSKRHAIDLFSGCGGLTQGLKDAGFSVIGAVENDPLAVATYEANHPEVHLWPEDIRNISVQEVSNKLKLKKGELDLLAGCPPCQGFSKLKTLNGARKVDDPRNNLLLEFKRFVIGLMPKAIMLENVPGLFNEKLFEEFSQRMIELGYKGKTTILNAADYSVPQRRRRLLYLAGYHVPVMPAEKVGYTVTVREAIGSLIVSGNSGDSLHDWPENRSERIRTLISKIPKDGGSRTDLDDDDQLDCHKRCDGFKDIYGRLKWDDVAPTITGGCFNPSKGRFLHPEEDRAITLREASLLQSFRDDYLFPIQKNKSDIALMIGNALPPKFVEHHAAEVANALTNAGF